MTATLPKLHRLHKPVTPDMFGIATSPLGPLFMAWQEAHLVRLTLVDTIDITQYTHLSRDDDRAVATVAVIFPNGAWRGVFAAPLSLGIHATNFRFAVLQAMNNIPPGDVVTYAKLAALAGKSGAARAAGSVCAGNTLPFVLPCHRVVQTGGGLGGFLYGVALKRRLLLAEGYVPAQNT